METASSKDVWLLARELAVASGSQELQRARRHLHGREAQQLLSLSLLHLLSHNIVIMVYPLWGCCKAAVRPVLTYRARSPTMLAATATH